MSLGEKLARIYQTASEENRRAILKAATSRPGGVLLDLGCGDGSFTTSVAERVRAGRIRGLELIDELAERADRRGVEVTVGDLGQRWPYEDDSVDVVHSNQVIEHVSFTDHFMSEIKRVLSPGGYALVSTNNLASWHNVASLIAGWQPPPCHVSDEIVVGNPANMMEGTEGTRGQMHLRVFTGRALAALANHHGLEVQLTVGAGYYPLPPRLARPLARIDPKHAAFVVQRYAAAPRGT